jgi:hypothetical protein
LSLLVALPPAGSRNRQSGRLAGVHLTSQWNEYELTGTVPTDVQTVTQGDFLFGSGESMD